MEALTVGHLHAFCSTSQQNAVFSTGIHSVITEDTSMLEDRTQMEVERLQ